MGRESTGSFLGGKLAFADRDLNVRSPMIAFLKVRPGWGLDPIVLFKGLAAGQHPASRCCAPRNATILTLREAI